MSNVIERLVLSGAAFSRVSSRLHLLQTFSLSRLRTLVVVVKHSIMKNPAKNYTKNCFSIFNLQPEVLLTILGKCR